MAIDMNPAPARGILHRTGGRAHGPITRLMSPGDLGQVLKPFVFLDLFDSGAQRFPPMGPHPHSGIATLTHVLEGSVRYADTSGAQGLLEAGGVEWMQAGGGVWHSGGAGRPEPTRGFQLWVALPPALELGPARSLYLGADDIVQVGPAKVLLGEHLGAVSAIAAPSSMTYLAVTLEAGERWTYAPPTGHTVLWAAIGQGIVTTPDRLAQGELVAFSPGEGAVEFVAVSRAQLVVGSAAPHDHDLVVGRYSVHTSRRALAFGEGRIDDLAAQLNLDPLTW